MTIIIGQVLDALGLASRLEVHPRPSNGWYPEVKRRCWATPATELRRHQPKSWANIGHDPHQTIGPVVWLQRDRGDRCWAVCVTDRDVPDGRWFYSAETDSNPDGSDVILTGVALVSATAQSCLEPVTLLNGNLDDFRSDHARRHISGPAREILKHATASEYHRDNGGGLIVHDLDPAAIRARHATATNAEQLPTRSVAWVDDHGGQHGQTWITPSTVLTVGGRRVKR